jgi:hypothetical protein
MLVTSDKLWAQLIVPPAVTLVWLVISSQILKLARTGGELDRARSKLTWFGAIGMLVVLYEVWFHSEMAEHWRLWAVLFLAGCIFLGGMGIVRRASREQVGRTWKNVVIFWLTSNAMGAIIVSIFGFFGN